MKYKWDSNLERLVYSAAQLPRMITQLYFQDIDMPAAMSELHQLQNVKKKVADYLIEKRGNPLNVTVKEAELLHDFATWLDKQFAQQSVRRTPSKRSDYARSRDRKSKVSRPAKSW